MNKDVFELHKKVMQTKKHNKLKGLDIDLTKAKKAKSKRIIFGGY